MLLFALVAAGSCRLYQLERRLSPAYADFYAKVQYIMTSEERKIFLELPDSDKDRFIDEFWERRNPNPDADGNAFKTEYEARVRRADELFRGEGKPGYLTDRGRIYILFGPPMDRLTYPMDSEGFCREVWYYGAFPVIFIDEHCQGQFFLTAINLEHLQALNIAQGHFQRTFEQENRFFDYTVSVAGTQPGSGAFKGKVIIDVPYAGLWLSFRDDRLSTTLDILVEVTDSSGARLMAEAKRCTIELSEDELKALKDKSYRIEIPFVPDRNSGPPKPGPLTLHTSVKNAAEGEELKKVLEFRLEP
jgi:GWxTD domain-containing protein